MSLLSLRGKTNKICIHHLGLVFVPFMFFFAFWNRKENCKSNEKYLGSMDIFSYDYRDQQSMLVMLKLVYGEQKYKVICKWEKIVKLFIKNPFFFCYGSKKRFGILQIVILVVQWELIGKLSAVVKMLKKKLFFIQKEVGL
jgi:hypothetical protein